jgi:hypothetical protein
MAFGSFEVRRSRLSSSHRQSCWSIEWCRLHTAVCASNPPRSVIPKNRDRLNFVAIYHAPGQRRRWCSQQRGVCILRAWLCHARICLIATRWVEGFLSNQVNFGGGHVGSVRSSLLVQARAPYLQSLKVRVGALPRFKCGMTCIQFRALYKCCD